MLISSDRSTQHYAAFLEEPIRRLDTPPKDMSHRLSPLSQSLQLHPSDTDLYDGVPFFYYKNGEQKYGFAISVIANLDQVYKDALVILKDPEGNDRTEAPCMWQRGPYMYELIMLNHYATNPHGRDTECPECPFTLKKGAMKVRASFIQQLLAQEDGIFHIGAQTDREYEISEEKTYVEDREEYFLECFQRANESVAEHLRRVLPDLD